MKFVVCSDAHSDWVTYGVPRRREVHESLIAAAQAAIEADALFFLGDLTDPEDGLAAGHALSDLLDAFEVARCPKIVIPGNHDVFEDGSGESALSPLGYLSGLGWTLIKMSRIVFGACGGKFDLLALPYVPSSHACNLELAVRGAGEWRASRHKNGSKKLPLVVIGHLTLPGVVAGEETREMPRGREVVFPYKEVAKLEPDLVLNGHYHKRQAFKAPCGLTIHIPGSMARLTIDQWEHEPAYLVVEL